MTEPETPASVVREEQTANENWKALENSFGENPTPVEAPKPEEPVKPEAPEEPADPFKPEEPVKPEEPTKPEESVKPEEPTKPEEKETPEAKPEEDLFKIEDSEAPTNEETSWKQLIEEKGFQLPENFNEENGLEVYEELVTQNLKTEYESKIEEARSLTLDKVFSQLKPETAAYLKLLEMGVPQEQIQNPTGQIEKLIGLPDAELYRKDLEERGYPEEVVDVKLEQASESPERLKALADAVRFDLNTTKTNILEARNQLIQSFEIKAKEAEKAARENQQVQFKQALDTVNDFLGKPIPQQAKNEVLKRYQSGEFDQSFNDPKSKVELAMFKLFGKNFVSAIKNTAFENGRDKVAKNLTNIPPVDSSGGGVHRPRPAENAADENFKAMENAFGKGQ